MNSAKEERDFTYFPGLNRASSNGGLRTQLFENLEIKAKRTSLAQDRKICQSLRAPLSGVLNQRDTYFLVKKGRLKLRQQEGKAAQLIIYFRPDEPQVRSCYYFLVNIPDPEPLRILLGECLGVLAEVRKRRELFLYKGVRIHLDQVESLGSFIELEAVLKRGKSVARAHETIEKLMSAFAIKEEELVARSYLDLVLEKKKEEGDRKGSEEENGKNG